MSCVLAGESRGGEKTASHPVGHLVSWTQRQANTSQSFSHLSRHTVSQSDRQTDTLSSSISQIQQTPSRQTDKQAVNPLASQTWRQGDSQAGRQAGRPGGSGRGQRICCGDSGRPLGRPLTHLPGRWWAAGVVGSSRDLSPVGSRSQASNFKAASVVVKLRRESVPQFSRLVSPASPCQPGCP